MKKISLAEITKLVSENRAVVIYPRKYMVSVDGFKKFSIDKDAVSSIAAILKSAK